MDISKFVSWAGLALGCAFILLQFYLSIPLRFANGDNLFGALWFLLTFFTVLTNIGVVLVHLSARTSVHGLGWFRQAHVRTIFAVLIFVVMLVYHFVLAPLWQPQGLFAVADIGLHYVTPLLYLAWWVTAPRGKTTKFSDIPMMLLPPILYLVWALARGLIVGEYPYPFLNYDVLGAALFARNIVGLFLCVALLYALFIFIENRLPRRT
jgi:hypothetical protein